ncbi:hypothetical protein [Thiohalobacter sp.]|uniref:hypothetical protein n=1 Tax=Thiohalobacter sp. TaxID=2025948 RepID=UPI002629AC0C|nr:hypothetical protein [Thiohalobacter sp.]
MTYFELDAVEPGMVVATDVEGGSGQILLRAGTRIDARHIRLLAAHAVKGLEIRTAACEAGAPDAAIDPARVEAAVDVLFRDTDTAHPFIQALMRVTRARMLQGNRIHERNDTER